MIFWPDVTNNVHPGWILRPKVLYKTLYSSLQRIFTSLHQGRWQSLYPGHGKGWAVIFWKYIFISIYFLLKHLNSFCTQQIVRFCKTEKASSVLFKRAISMAFIYESVPCQNGDTAYITPEVDNCKMGFIFFVIDMHSCWKYPCKLTLYTLCIIFHARANQCILFGLKTSPTCRELRSLLFIMPFCTYSCLYHFDCHICIDMKHVLVCTM